MKSNCLTLLRGYKLKAVLFVMTVIASPAALFADITWDFSGGDTQGWWGAQGQWEGSMWSDGQTLKNFTYKEDAVVENGRLGAPANYLASPTDFNDWGRYIGGGLTIRMNERCSDYLYHQVDGILDGGTTQLDGSTESTHAHPRETFPYVFMTTTVNGEETLLASKLIFTEGESTQTITFDEGSWMLIDLSLIMDEDGGPGDGPEVTISGSFLSAAEFEEAMNNCGGIFIRSEYGAGGMVGGVQQWDYMTQIMEIGIYEIPEPSVCAVLSGMALLGWVLVFRKKAHR